MNELTHRKLSDANGIRNSSLRNKGMGHWCCSVMDSGVVVLVASSLNALSLAGFHAVAPDMRATENTDRPAEDRTLYLVSPRGRYGRSADSLGEEQAVIVGHDWGAPGCVACGAHAPRSLFAQCRTQRSLSASRQHAPTSVMPQNADASFYQLYFQTSGVVEAELEADARISLRKILFSGSGDVPRRNPGASSSSGVGMVPRAGGFLTRMPNPETLPAWLSDADVDFYVQQFQYSGFRGGLNWYRNIDRNWELMAPYAGAAVTVPALLHRGRS